MKRKRKKLLHTIEITIAGIIAITCLIIYFQFLRGLPTIHLSDFQVLPQASIITDREGNELFRFYDQNRRRTPYAKISSTMINAIVSTEDKGFRKNEGVERKSIIRAGLSNIETFIGTKDQIQGASTITQQLIKNIMLTKEKKIKRKLQEIILAQRLTTKRSDEIRKKYPNTSKDNIDHKTKEQILATYLNYVYYGNHSYGITAAAKNYFRTTPDKLTNLQSAILASLPQAPSRYNPAIHPETVIGNRSTKHKDDKKIILPHKSSEEIQHIQKRLQEKKLTITDTESCMFSITERGTIITNNQSKIIYEPGRKDRVLCRMYEDKKITIQELRDALIESTNLKLYTATNTIKAPHFVFWVQKFLQTSPIFKDYHIDDQILSQGGWTIRTSLSPQDQKIASKIISNNMNSVHNQNGNNRALIHVDSFNGDVLSYIGSANYYDDKIKGKNDIIQATRQIGSTIKPLIYSYIYKNFGRSINAPILDMPLPKEYAKHGQPRNADRLYRGRIPMKAALAGSRNVPLARIFYALGREWTFVPYLRSLGFTNLQENKKYGYSVLLGAGEGKMIQLANSYIELSSDSQNKVAQINPIISITNAQGKVIYDKNKDLSYQKERIIPHTVSYMIRQILSNIGHAPKDRYYFIMMPSMERKFGSKSYAIKTGTSEKKVGTLSRPSDARMTSYTNRDIIISRAGHTDGKAMKKDGYGLYLNHRIIKDYYRNLIENKLLLGSAKKKPKDYQGYYKPVKGKNPSDREIDLLQIR